MTYTKPEINVLGDALNIIQFVPKGSGTQLDPQDPTRPIAPAYDLDE